MSVKASRPKKLQMLDMSRAAVSGKQHVQWLKDLNNSIRNRIAAHLTGRFTPIDQNNLNKNEGFPSI